MAWFTCTVNAAGPASDATETAVPVIYINLTDQGGSFTDNWFFAADNSKQQMLAVALNAISLGATVQMGGDPPNASNNPFTQIDRLYLNSS
jgi:hypothetical protein